MTRFEPTQGPDNVRMDDEEDMPSTTVRPPVVEAGKDRLNPPVEYEVLDLAGTGADALKAKLNELGNDGWVLVAAEPSFIFRRVKKADEEKKRGRVGFSV